MSAMLEQGDQPTGFAAPVEDAQQAFRSILEATSTPGRITRIEARFLLRAYRMTLPRFGDSQAQRMLDFSLLLLDL